MLQWILNVVFGCSHERTTFPLTPDKKKGRVSETYVACLDCGRELTYDWKTMTVGGPIKSKSSAQPSSTVVNSSGEFAG